MTLSKKIAIAAGTVVLVAVTLCSALAAGVAKDCEGFCPKSGPCGPCPPCPGC